MTKRLDGQKISRLATKGTTEYAVLKNADSARLSTCESREGVQYQNGRITWEELAARVDSLKRGIDGGTPGEKVAMAASIRAAENVLARLKAGTLNRKSQSLPGMQFEYRVDEGRGELVACSDLGGGEKSKVLLRTADGKTRGPLPMHDNYVERKGIALAATINLVDDHKIKSILAESGVDKKRGLLGAILFAARQSTGSMDYVMALKGELLVIGNKVYDEYDAGNLLWGAAMRHLGIPLWIARAGAQVNQLLFGWRQNKEVKPLTLDDPADQRAIREGYEGAKAGRW